MFEFRVSAAAKKNKESCKLCQVHEDIELYESMIFHFVKSDLKELKGPQRATIADKDRKELEEKGVFLHDEQRRGKCSFIMQIAKYTYVLITLYI